MVQVSVKVTGANETIKTLGVIRRRVNKAEDEVAKKLAVDVRKGARQRVRLRLRKYQWTGNLWNNIMVRKLRKGAWITESTAINKKGFSYSAALELGAKPHPIKNAFGKGDNFVVNHPGNKPYNFMQDAFQSTASRAKKIAGNEIKKAIGGK